MGCELLILGGGPAGFAAALYAARAGIHAVVLEKLSHGGQMALTEQIDNYPGFDGGVDGFELSERMKRGAERYGAKMRLARVDGLVQGDGEWIVRTSEGMERARALIIATGARPRKLNLEKEDKFRGRGVHYCAACDGMRYRSETVALVGGGNSAAADALSLSRVCKRVILIHRRDRLRAEKYYRDAMARAGNIEYCMDSALEKLEGDEKLEKVCIRHLPSGGLRRIEVAAAFIAIGREPETEPFREVVKLDDAGYIAAGEDTLTSAPGIFAAGDVRTKPLRQIITAAADGAAAAMAAESYLTGK